MSSLGIGIGGLSGPGLRFQMVSGNHALGSRCVVDS